MGFWKTVLAVVVGITIYGVVDNLVVSYCAQPGACEFAK